MPELIPAESSLDIDLAREPLRLWICGRCKALTMKEDEPRHIEWHERLKGADDA